MFFPRFLVSGRRVLLRRISRLICLGVIALESACLAAAPPPPIEPAPEAALVALAQKKFGTLSRGEEAFFRAVQEGDPASALSEDERENDPANAANWPADRAVRATCIAWLCTDPQASAFVTHRGLGLVGMRIDGPLDLSDAEIKFPLRASKCAFSGDIFLRDAQLRGFYLLESKINGLSADRAIINGSVILRGLKAEGEVNLTGAKIGGDLACEGAHFSNEGGRALIADGAQIKGTVYLDDVRAKGEVNLVGTKIGGDLACVGGQFSKPDGLALNADSAKIERSVFLRGGFRAEGKVSFQAATIGGLQIVGILEADKLVLDLRLTKVETFWDDQGSWPKAGNLAIDGFRYERLYEKAPFQADSRKKWLSLQRRDRFRPQPYEQLAAVLRQMGHERDARLVMIEKNRERARFTHFPQQGWWWYNFFGRLIGYGYAPWRAFAASLGMIFLGTVLFHLGSTRGLISPTSENAYVKAPEGQVIEENGRRKISQKYPVFNAFFYSLESFTPLLKLDQSANWTPDANRSAEISSVHLKVPFSGNFLRYYLYFHIAAGWLLTSLWVGAVTGLVKT